MLIQDRIRTIMKSGNLTASEFADNIGVKRSNLSHVLSGRNKPSLDFLVKIINNYPNVNASWLITGEARDEHLSQTTEDSSQLVNEARYKVLKKKSDDSSGELARSDDKRISRIVIFYEDGTFNEFRPNQQ